MTEFAKRKDLRQKRAGKTFPKLSKNRKILYSTSALFLSASCLVGGQAVAQNQPSSNVIDVAKFVENTKQALKLNPVVSAPIEDKWEQFSPTKVEVVVTTPKPEPAPISDANPQSEQTQDVPQYQDLGFPTSNQNPSASDIVNTATQFVGVPYLWGGNNPGGFDCSGFVKFVFARHGIHLPRTAASQGQIGQLIPMSEAKPGDLLYWPAHHVAIYVGNGMMIDASVPGEKIAVRPIWGQPLVKRIR